MPALPTAPLDISLKQHKENTFTCPPQMLPCLTLPCADVEAATSLTDSTNLISQLPLWDSSPPPTHRNKSVTHFSNGGLEWGSYLLESQDLYKTCQSGRFSTNKEVEDDNAGAETANKLPSSSLVGEFYDAFDELSTDSGTHSSINNIDIELRGMRLTLLMEIERRRQAEETLEQLQLHWQKLREQLAHVGLFVPLDPISSSISSQYSINIAAELRCQLDVTWFVSESLGNDLAKAEVEIEMERELEAKNFEFIGLSDRLHYYETVNKEMSQRNQEAIGRKTLVLFVFTRNCFVLVFFSRISMLQFFNIRDGKTRPAKEKGKAEMDLGINCCNHHAWWCNLGLALPPYCNFINGYSST
ncbi:unnamed protein product [Cochlearia groenlandica]